MANRKRRNRFRSRIYDTGKATIIFKRDGYLCRYCGEKVFDLGMIYGIVDTIKNELCAQYCDGKITRRKYLYSSDTGRLFNKAYRKHWPVIATVDHVIPITKNGSDELDNLKTACMKCNIKKGARDAGTTP